MVAVSCEEREHMPGRILGALAALLGGFVLLTDYIGDGSENEPGFDHPQKMYTVFCGVLFVVGVYYFIRGAGGVKRVP
jgi:peptidoglycan/LPS O-acetylase OafA/YrhL